MQAIGRIPRVALIALAALAVSSAANAAQRTFVASNGLDSHPCSLGAPCRSFAAAIAHTDPGGEVIVLDSAGYGVATITQSVSIVAPQGIYAGVSVFSGDGITINGTGIRVALRGLTINGQGGTNGIRVLNADEVHVESCVVSNMTSAAIDVSSGKAIIVKDSIIRGNQGYALTQTNSYGSYDNVRSDRNYGGLAIVGGAATVSRSTFNQNVIGINTAQGTDGSPGDLTLESSVLHGNAGFGLWTEAPSAVYVNRVDIDRNGQEGVRAESGSFIQLNQSSVSRNGSLASSPDINAFGSAKVGLQQSVINGSSSGTTITGGSVFTYGNNVIEPPASGLIPSALQ